MNSKYRDSVSLSHHISKYPLVCTALACLLCLCVEQNHEISYYSKVGISGSLNMVAAVPGAVISALLVAVLTGLVRAGEQSNLKRALYISAGCGALFLCWRGLISANRTVFDICAFTLTLVAAVLCVYLAARKKVYATAVAAVSVLALGLATGFGVVSYVFALLVAGALIIIDNSTALVKRIFAVAALALGGGLAPVVYSTADNKLQGLLVAGVLFCIGCYCVGLSRGKCKIPAGIMLMFGLGLIMRLGYVLDIALPQNQHDVFSVFNKDYPRHNTYIMHIYQHWSLPTEHVYNAGLSQYYHPPLYHFLAALWMKAQTLCGIDLYSAYENIQYFTMFCSAAMMTVGYKLFCEFKLKGVVLYTAFAVLAFHPSFYIFAGSVNNDPLTTLLLFLAVLYTVRWYKEQSVKNTVLLAVSIGGAMMTKLSGAMVAFGTAYVMLARIFDQETGGFVQNLKRLWKRFVLFGAVCFPLGLWWPVRCAVKYGMPLGYVPGLGISSPQYLGNYSIFQRLTGIGSWSLSNMFPNIGGTLVTGDKGHAGFYDYGIAPYAVKSSLFGEYFNKQNVSAFQNILAYVMVFTALALIALSIYGAVKVVISEKGEHKVPVRFLAIYHLVLAGSYVLFCFSYPHTCTMDFRYIVPCLLTGAVFTGMYLSGKKSLLKYTAFAVSAIFSLSSAAFYFISF